VEICTVALVFIFLKFWRALLYCKIKEMRPEHFLDLFSFGVLWLWEARVKRANNVEISGTW
jgi:hypothetical protein